MSLSYNSRKNNLRDFSGLVKSQKKTANDVKIESNPKIYKKLTKIPDDIKS